MTTTYRLDTAPIPVSRHLPTTAPELLIKAASTANPETRVKVIDQAADTVRKTWPEYFQPGA